MYTKSRKTNKTFGQIKEEHSTSTKVQEEEMENFSMKKLMVKAGIQPQVSRAGVRGVMRRAGMK